MRQLASLLVGVLKALIKITLLIIVAGALAGVVAMLKRPKGAATPVSYDQWPDVASKPAS